MTTPAEQIAINSAQSQISSIYIDKMGLVSVKSFGAKGDNIANDTKAIRNAKNFANTNGLKSLFFPHGTYKVDAGLGNELTGLFLWGDNSTITGDTIPINQIGTNITEYNDQFLGLVDAPKSFTGYSKQVVSVKTDESALEFVNLEDTFYTEQEVDAKENGIKARMDNHVNGAAEKHAGTAITLDPTGKTKITADDVQEAIDQIENEIKQFVDVNVNAEVGDAHTSTAKVKTFEDIRARFEETETDVKNLDSQMAENPKVDYSFLNLLESGQITSIKLIGDSITVGVPLANPDSSRPLIGSTGIHEADVTSATWANFLRNFTLANYPSISFFNAGIGGWSAKAEGNTNGTNWYGTGNDFCFVMLGTNDRADCTSEDDFQTAIETFIKGVQANCNHLIVMTAPPTNNDFDSSGIKEVGINLTMEQIDKVISRVCVKNGWKHISFYRKFLEYQMNTQTSFDYLLQTDGGSHPIASGYMLIWKILQQELGLVRNTYDWINNTIDTGKMNLLSETGSLITSSSPITAFRANYITVHTIGINHPDKANFPEAINGTLITVRPYSDSFGYQKYIIYQIGRVYTRYWTGSAWSTWVSGKEITSLSGGSISSTTPITSFAQNCITYHAISSGHTDVANFPFGLGGMLKTVRAYSDSFSWQEFIVYDKGWSAKRWVNGSGWRPWVIETNITGNTASRPITPPVGTMYYDQSLAKPIYYISGVWKDATGTAV